MVFALAFLKEYVPEGCWYGSNFISYSWSKHCSFDIVCLGELI